MYKLTKNLQGQVNGVETQQGNLTLGIPFVEGNTDYQAYLKWVAEGNTPLPAEGTE
jgi:hypothetical protein